MQLLFYYLCRDIQPPLSFRSEVRLNTSCAIREVVYSISLFYL